MTWKSATGRLFLVSEAKQFTVPLPPARRFGRASSADAANPEESYCTTGFGNSSVDHLVDRWMASLRSQ
jgi:hypothetical protein